MARLLTPPSHHPWPIGAPARPVEGHRAKRKPFEVKSTLIGVDRASSGSKWGADHGVEEGLECAGGWNRCRSGCRDLEYRKGPMAGER
ncbi:hypothetical protein Acr_10g0007720 [Actinidia rufa]|uniref:Uncharacterized protein n=1 Tax=Actinidia rufa TaxID=165716 RepID=A0A7J0FBW7_9ERIC|nr:hypothetical protein Acr_10g0007720 [Actinidia rufa]